MYQVLLLLVTALCAAQAVNTTIADTMLLAAGKGGLWRSTDGFVTRTKVIDGAVDKVEFQNQSTAVIATGEKIWRSTDAGATFSVVYEHPKGLGYNFSVTRFSFAAGGVMGMAVAQRIFPKTTIVPFDVIGSNMLATTDGGATWAQRGKITIDGTIYSGVTALGGAESGREPRFARFTEAGVGFTVSVDVTTDLGDSWAKGSAIFENFDTTLFTAEDSNIYSTETEIFVTGWTHNCKVKRASGISNAPLQSGVIYRSGDSGQSWTQEVPAPNAAVTSVTSVGTTYYGLAFAGNSACPAGDESCSQDIGTIYAAAGAVLRGNSQGYLSRSDDGGTTWFTVREDTDHSSLRDVAVSPSRAGEVCAVGCGLNTTTTYTAVVSCSMDGGKTWKRAPPLVYPKLYSTRHLLWQSLSIALA